MIRINEEECIGCGLCEKDCFVRDIEIVDNKAKVKNIACMKCGHCIAVCPQNVVSIDEYNMEDVLEYNKEDFDIEENNLLNFIKFRRTVRQFKNQKVEKEKLLKIVEAGRYTQTGSNSQNVSYVVVTEKINELKILALEKLNEIGEQRMLEDCSPLFKRYGQMWIDMYNENKKNPNGEDKLFFHAPAIILVVSESEVDGALASSNMELVTNSLGLGTLFSGFFVRGAKGNKKVTDLLGLEENSNIVTCMIIGYPEVKYLRTVPRKESNIIWK